MTAAAYVYRVVDVERVVDGDTFWVRIDVGFRQWQLTEIRLQGWDCPERHAAAVAERVAAAAATDLTAGFLSTALAAGELWVQTAPDPDNFGRWLGRTWRDSDPPADLGEALEAAQLATAWPTRWHEVYGTD